MSQFGTAAADECRRWVQQGALGHRGRNGDTLYGIQNLLRAGAENLTDKQWARFEDGDHCRRRRTSDRLHRLVVRPAAPRRPTATPNPAEGRELATKIVDHVPDLPGRPRSLRLDPHT